MRTTSSVVIGSSTTITIGSTPEDIGIEVIVISLVTALEKTQELNVFVERPKRGHGSAELAHLTSCRVSPAGLTDWGG